MFFIFFIVFGVNTFCFYFECKSTIFFLIEKKNLSN